MGVAAWWWWAASSSSPAFSPSSSSSLPEVYPLFKPPTAAFVGGYGTAGADRQPAPGDALGLDEYREVAYLVTARGRLDFLALKGGPTAPPVPMPGLDGATVTAVVALGKSRLLLGTSDGRIIPLDMKFDVTFKDGQRTVMAAPVFAAATALDPDKKRAVHRLTWGGLDAGGVTVAQVGPTELVIQSVIERKALIGGTRREESRQSFAPDSRARSPPSNSTATPRMPSSAHRRGRCSVTT